MMSNTFFLKLAFKNVFRHKRRSILTMVVIMFSVGTLLFMLSYLEGVWNNVIEDSVRASGHISIEHPEYQIKERMLSLNVTVENYEQLKTDLTNIEGVKCATGRIRFGGLLDFGENNEPGMGMGIDPVLERDILQIENLIIEGRYFGDDPRETIIGVNFANKLHIGIGDTITVISRTAYSSLAAENLIVVGIADMLNSMLNNIFYISLETAQQLLDMEDQVAQVMLFIDNPDQLEEMKEKILATAGIGDNYSVIMWNERGMLKDMGPMIQAFIGIMILLFGSIAAFSVINTMLMSVLERTKEIGVFTSFGMKRRNVLRVFLIEALVIGAFGGLMGLIAGGYGGYWLENTGLTIGEVVENFPIPLRQTLYGDLKWSQAGISFIFGLVLSLVASYFPALKAARLEPTDALRHR